MSTPIFAVHPRHHDIQHHKVRQILPRLFQAFLAVIGRLHRVTRALQRLGHLKGNDPHVLPDQDAADCGRRFTHAGET
jgi:hypothetical protein